MGQYGTAVLNKIIVLFMAMISGYIAKKAKMLDSHSSKALSAMLAKITTPCLLVASLQKDCDPAVLLTAGKVFIMSVLIHLTMMLISHFIFKGIKDRRDRSVFSFGLTYMNCGFMGFPILLAMFGEIGLFYGVIYNIPFNVFSWTQGVALMNASDDKKIDFKKVFLNPGIIGAVLASILFISGIRFPSVITEGLSMVGDMTFPLSMVIIGSLLADIKLITLFTDFRVILFSVIKLAVVPLAMLGISLLANNFSDGIIALVCVTLCATPAAANTVVMSEVYDNNSALAAKIVGLSTLFSLVSMPLILILAEKLILIKTII